MQNRKIFAKAFQMIRLLNIHAVLILLCIGFLSCQPIFAQQDFPATLGTFDEEQLREAVFEWNIRTLYEPVVENGLSCSQDQFIPTATNLLISACRHFSKTEPAPSTDFIIRAAELSFALKCEDPLITYLYGITQRWKGNLSRSKEMLEQARDELSNKPTYPYIRKLFAANALWSLYSDTGMQHLPVSQELEREIFNNFVYSVSSGEFSEPHEIRHALTLFTEIAQKLIEQRGPDNTFWPDLLKRLRAEAPNEVWLIHMISGRIHLKEWRDRRDDALKVSPDSSDLSKLDPLLEKAGKEFLLANHAGQLFPEAPEHLMTIARRIYTDEFKSVDYWFAEAVKRQSDYMPAYYNYMGYLSNDHDSLFAFAQWCIDTQKFDSSIPEQSLNILSSLEKSLDLEPGDIFKTPKFYTLAKQYFNGALALKSNSGKQNYIRAQALFVAIHGDDKVFAEKLFDGLGSEASATISRMKRWRVEPAAIEQYLGASIIHPTNTPPLNPQSSTSITQPIYTDIITSEISQQENKHLYNHEDILSLLPEQASAHFSFYDPSVKEVSVAGTFNQWNMNVTPLIKRENGHWEASVPLAPGQYAYKLIVDGTWILDPATTKRMEVNGVENSMIYIKAKH